MWQHVKLSEQIRPRDTLACCWDVKQPTNKQTSSLYLSAPPPPSPQLLSLLLSLLVRFSACVPMSVSHSPHAYLSVCPPTYLSVSLPVCFDASLSVCLLDLPLSVSLSASVSLPASVSRIVCMSLFCNLPTLSVVHKRPSLSV